MTELVTPAASTWRQFYALTKPRVVQLIVFCALIGMVLAVPGMPSGEQLRLGLIACAGIWLVAGAAAAFNFLVEKNIVTVSGISKEAVGQIAAVIRETKKAEPYKGKGIKYQGEKIRRKEGKKVVATKK